MNSGESFVITTNNLTHGVCVCGGGGLDHHSGAPAGGLSVFL